MLRCKCLDLSHAGAADPPLRNIDNTKGRQIVPSVVNRLQIGQNVLDFLTLIEVYASHHAVRHIALKTFFLDQTGLGISPVKNRAVLIAAFAVLNIAHDGVCFLRCRLKLLILHQRPFLVSRPQRLGLSPPVVADHLVGRV